MKFVVRTSKEKEKELRFFLQEQDGEILLCAETEGHGTWWNILRINRGGRLELFVGLSPGIGLDVNQTGTIRVTG